jgi:DNA-binding SARP family transcriptional activator/Tfp pilus assembly protein PilF
MEFRVLGPLEVTRAGRALRLGAARERSVLAILLLNANGVVAVNSLVDQLWPDAPPETAVHAVHVSVSRLRRVLDDERGRRIETRKPGYVLRAESGELDLHVFVRLCREARALAARGDPESASALFGEASALWRGPALADLAEEPFAGAAAARLDESRMEAVEERIAADLELGRHASLVAELEEWVAVYPLRERLRAQLMRALYACGRQADALALFRETRATLVDELGIEPGRELREVEASILAWDSRPDRTRPGAGGQAQLPLDTASFTGRIQELDQILALVTTAGDGGVDATPGLIAICAMDGMAGIGKTTLALRAAHLLASRFPDGRLFIDLHGHTDKVAPVDPGQALDRLLRAIGVAGDRIPADPEDRAALYRSELASKRVMIVLDNARDGTQVRPLLPAAPGCLVLVTSRRRLSALDDATVVSLDVLPPSDAAALFGKVAGEDRVAGHDRAVQQIVQLCGRLPLALRIAAARLRHRPMWTPGQLAERLAGEHTRLSELVDSDRSVAAAFAMSYRELDDEHRRLFRLLGLQPGSDLDLYAAAALADTGLDATERLVEDLLDANLLTQVVRGRYQFHDLMRAYAARLADEQDTDPDREAALTRLLDYYLHATGAAVGKVLPSQRRRTPTLPPSTTLVPPMISAGDALGWLDAERTTSIAMVVHLDGARWPSQLAQLGQILSMSLRFGSRGTDTLTVSGRLLEIARAEEDWPLEAAAWDGLAWGHIALHHYREAFEEAQRALPLYQQLGDGIGECSALNCLGYSVGDKDPDAAAGYFRQALTAARAVGDHEGEGRALNNLSTIYAARGRYREEMVYLKQSLVVHERAGNPAGMSLSLLNLGGLHVRLGRDEQALDCLRESLTLARETGFRLAEPAALDVIGRVLQRRGRYAEAVDHHLRALALARDSGDEEEEADFLVSLGETRLAQEDTGRALEEIRRAVALATRGDNRQLRAVALNALGRALLVNGQSQEARHSHEHALTSARDLNRYEEARALDGIATTYHCDGESAHARHFWLRALAIYTDLEVPEADEVRVHLRDLDVIA